MFVLDLDEIHAGVAEVFQVLVYSCLAAMVGRVEVQEESSGNVFGLLAGIKQAQHCITFVHGGLQC